MQNARIIQGFDVSPTLVCDWSQAEFADVESASTGPKQIALNYEAIILNLPPGLVRRKIYFKTRLTGIAPLSGGGDAYCNLHADFYDEGSLVGRLPLDSLHQNNAGSGTEQAWLWGDKPNEATFNDSDFTYFNNGGVVTDIGGSITGRLEGNIMRLIPSDNAYNGMQYANPGSFPYSNSSVPICYVHPIFLFLKADQIRITIDKAQFNSLWIYCGVLSTQA